MKITVPGSVLVDRVDTFFDIGCPNVTLIRCKAKGVPLPVGAAPVHGILVRQGASATLINCESTGASGRGCQADKGHLGLTIHGGSYHHNINDGIGTDIGGPIEIIGAECCYNGLPGVDSRDGIQISGRPLQLTIMDCKLHDHHNAGLVGEFAGGLIARNVCYRNRHGIAVAGNRALPLIVAYNALQNNENGLFFYQESCQAVVYADTLNTYSGNTHAQTFDAGVSRQNVKLT